jgi:hypothetical protein
MVGESSSQIGSENRRANRISWERPIRITHPYQISGRVLNVSSLGLLVRVDRGYVLRRGDMAAVEIPRSDGVATLTRHVRIVRIETTENEMLLGLELV